MINKKILAIFRLEDESPTEYTLFDDMTYRCNHWEEHSFSSFRIEYGLLIVMHMQENFAPWVKKTSYNEWIACPDDEMNCYRMLRERIELEYVIHGLLIDKNMLK